MSGFRSLLLALFLVSATSARAAQVDTLVVPSTAMRKTYCAAVVLPAS